MTATLHPARRITIALPIALALSLTATQAARAAATNYSVQNDLSGATAVAPLANYGAGVVYGDIDTGITPQWIGFTPTYNGQGVFNIDTVNSGKCLNGVCTMGGTLTDGNGHGTFTASEIVGGIQTAGANMSGVARAGTLISVQVLNAQGSGSSTDIANGIRYAADHGAQVLNLSLGPSGSGAQQAAFYNSVASAINYAASKGVYVVFAGGNSAQALAGGKNVTGYTDAAIQHLVFVGSTNNGDNVHASTTKISSFSNTPGSGNFVSTTGKTTADKNIWLMANGGEVKQTWFSTTITDGIWGASNSNSGNCAGYGCITQEVGTSMAAPQVTGAIGLLIAKWPVLITNGTAAQILEQTAVDLGTKGVDKTYGTGFLNLTAAFQPVGGTYALTSGGKTVNVGGGGAVTGGALGSMSHISRALSNYTFFDGYQRNFTGDLSGLVSTKPSMSSALIATTAPKTTVRATQFADGSQLAFGNAEQDSFDAGRPANLPGTSDWFLSFTDAAGSTLAAGHGFPSSASFAYALWGDGPRADASVATGASNALTSLAEGGQFTALGTQLDGSTRMAFSWSQTEVTDPMSSADWTRPNANAFSTGLSHRFTSRWVGGLTFGLLNEQAGMLGTTYDVNGPLSLGAEHRSLSLGLSSSFIMGGGRELMLDAAIARADGQDNAVGLISNVSPMYARSFGAALTQRDAVKPGDLLSLSLRAPLRVYSGTAMLATTEADGTGFASTTNQRVNLRPDGNELNLTVGYQAPIRNHLDWNASLEGRRDADNIAGQNDVTGRVGMRYTF